MKEGTVNYIPNLTLSGACMREREGDASVFSTYALSLGMCGAKRFVSSEFDVNAYYHVRLRGFLPGDVMASSHELGLCKLYKTYTKVLRGDKK